MTATTYSPERKAEALLLYMNVGLAEAWRQTGIPKPTISSWARRAGLPHTNAATKTAEATAAAAEAAKLTRARLRGELLDKALDLLQRMDAQHVEFKGKDAQEVIYPIAPASAVQAYAISVGVLIDKYRLEMGEVTGRTESRAMTEGLDDTERERLREFIDRLTVAPIAEGAQG